MKNEKWEMFVSPFYAPHSASLHVGLSTIYPSPKRICICGSGAVGGIENEKWGMRMGVASSKLRLFRHSMPHIPL